MHARRLARSAATVLASASATTKGLAKYHQGPLPQLARLSFEASAQRFSAYTAGSSGGQAAAGSSHVNGASGTAGGSTAGTGATSGGGATSSAGNGAAASAPSSGAAVVSGSAQKEYTFWQSAEVVFAKREAPRLIGRWDWHLWQLFVALIPSAVIVGLAKYAQWKLRLADDAKAKENSDAAEAEAEAAKVRSRVEQAPAELADRMEAIEATLRALQARLDERPAAGSQRQAQPQADSPARGGGGASPPESRAAAPVGAQRGP